MTVGVPPAAATFEMPASFAKKIVPSVLQLAPRPRSGGTSQMAAGGPPAIGTFLILSSVQNPIQAPSGEKNGPLAPSVPAMGVASGRSSGRKYNCAAPFFTALKTTSRPSGEIATAVRLGRG